MKSDARDRLIRQMIEALYRLGDDAMARIDARLWAEHFRRRAKKLKIPVDRGRDR